MPGYSIKHLRVILLILVAQASAYAAITNVRANRATPTAFVLEYTAPDGTACTHELSESVSYSPLVNDVNTSLFANSNSDSVRPNLNAGRYRKLVMGMAGRQDTYAHQRDSDTRRYSRALRMGTRHYGRINCSGDTATYEVVTAGGPAGDQSPRLPIPIDPADLGKVAFPYADLSQHGQVIIDPITGFAIQQFSVVNQTRIGASEASDYARVAFSNVYQGTGWTNLSNVLANDGSVTDSSGTNPIAVVTNTNVTGSTYMVGMVGRIKAYADNGLSGNDLKIRVCLTVDGGLTCYGKYVEVTLLTQASYAGAFISFGDPDPSSQPSFTSAVYPPFGAWLNVGQLPPSQSRVQPRTGTADSNGTTALVLNYAGTNGAFDQGGPAGGAGWVNGSHIIFNGTEYTIATITDPVHVTLSGSPATATAATWTARNFGFIVNKLTSTGVVHIDYIEHSRVEYRGPLLLNQGSGDSHQSTYRRYHDGWRVVTPGCTNATPIVCTVVGPDPTARLTAGTSQVKVLNVPGNTAANATWTVSARTYNSGTKLGTITLQSSSGNGAWTDNLYNGGGQILDLAGRTGFIVQTSSSGNVPQLWWVDPDNPALNGALDTRYLGEHFIDNNIGGGIPGTGSAAPYSIDESNPDLPDSYAVVLSSGSGEYELLKGTFAGNSMAANGGLFQHQGFDFGGGNNFSRINWAWTKVTNGPTDSFGDRVRAVNSAFPDLFGIEGVTEECKFAFGGKYGDQNTLGWIGVYNVCTNTVLAATNTYQNSNYTNCALHTFHPSYGTGIVSMAGYQLAGTAGAYSGPYFVTTNTSMPSGVGETGFADCATEFSTSPAISNPLNITGNRCTRVGLTSKQMTSGPSGNPADHDIGTIRVGSFLVRDILTHQEWMRVIGVAASTNEIVVQRAIGSDHRNTANSSGTQLQGLCPPPVQIMQTALPGSTTLGELNAYYDYNSAPTGDNGNDPYQQNIAGAGFRRDYVFPNGSHWTIRSHVAINDQGVGANPCPGFASSAKYALRAGTYTGGLALLDDTVIPTCTEGNPSFGGITGWGQGNPTEKHPGADNPASVAVGNNSKWFVDARVVNPTSGPTELSNYTTTNISGNLWRVRGIKNAQSEAYDPKRHSLYIGVGQHPLLDVSQSGGYTLPGTSGFNYTYCAAVANADCDSASQAGDVIVNAPNVTDLANGWTGGDTGKRCPQKLAQFVEITTICAFVITPAAFYVTQYSNGHDPFARGSVRVSNAFQLPMDEDSLWNSYTLPNGAGAFINSIHHGTGLYLLWFAHTGNYPGPDHSINRGDSLPIPIPFTSVVPGTSTVLVEYGYDPSLNCLRAESCMANAATIQTGANVFKWAGEAPAGLSCATSCTIMVAAHPARMMWYRKIFRNSGGTTIATSKIEVMAVP